VHMAVLQYVGLVVCVSITDLLNCFRTVVGLSFTWLLLTAT
jgi:hypothetical protein